MWLTTATTAVSDATITPHSSQACHKWATRIAIPHNHTCDWLGHHSPEQHVTWHLDPLCLVRGPRTGLLVQQSLFFSDQLWRSRPSWLLWLYSLNMLHHSNSRSVKYSSTLIALFSNKSKLIWSPAIIYYRPGSTYSHAQNKRGQLTRHITGNTSVSAYYRMLCWHPKCTLLNEKKYRACWRSLKHVGNSIWHVQNERKKNTIIYITVRCNMVQRVLP